MAFTTIELVVSLTVILGAAIVFTNAVEVLGGRLHLSGGAVGSVLAAVGTGLPETMIPLVAIVVGLITGSGGTSGISIGAIIGAPFLLMTLGMLVIGASAVGWHRRRGSGTEVTADMIVVRRDTGYFLVLFTAAAAAGFVPLPLFAKIVIAIVLVGTYAFYVYRTLESESGKDGDPPGNLLLWPAGRGEAPTWIVLAQVLATITVMAAGAHYFTVAVEELSRSVGIPAGLIALILAPLATELPEKFNSAYWMRDNKDSLAFGNVSGATVFQSAVPASLGIVFTPWSLSPLDGLAAALAILSGVVLLAVLRRETPLRGTYLLPGGVLYAGFLVVAVIALLAR